MEKLCTRVGKKLQLWGKSGKSEENNNNSWVSTRVDWVGFHIKTYDFIEKPMISCMTSWGGGTNKSFSRNTKYYVVYFEL